MKKRSLVCKLAVSGMLAAIPAHAQTFSVTGSTQGCFALDAAVGSCVAANNPVLNIGTTATMTYNRQAAVSAGPVTVGSTSSYAIANLGSFVFNGGTQTEVNSNIYSFNLYLTIASPTPTGGATQNIIGELSGKVKDSGSQVDIDFDGFATFAYNNSQFWVTVDNIVDIKYGQTRTLTGSVYCQTKKGKPATGNGPGGSVVQGCGQPVVGGQGQALAQVVPEPATYVLMLSGLLGLGLASRIRRRSE